MRWFAILVISGWAQPLQITVERYALGDFLRAEHTCDGANIPPLITWRPIPQAKAYVVWFYDPDAPTDTFTHWLVVNYRDTTLGPRQAQLGLANDFGQIGYSGPCPPKRDKPHRYVIRVYGLSVPIKVRTDANWSDVRDALRGLVLSQGEYTLRYQRQ